MRLGWVLAVAVAVTSVANAASIDPVDAWRPMHPFIGTWKGTRTGDDGQVKVTRVYESSTTNHHLEIREKLGGRSGGASVWGVVSFEPQRQVLVLRQFAADGSAFDVSFDPSSSTAGPLVFESLASEGSRTRITYERAGTNSFVERIERSSGGGSFGLVSETRFTRTN